MPHARTTDQQTSHEAAESVTAVTATQRAILKLLRKPMTDEQLVELYALAVNWDEAPKASASGIRSRRAELHRRGWLAPVGVAKTASGRKALVWSVA